MADRGNLVELLIGMVGAGGVSAFFGCVLLRQGWRNLREGRVPLGGTVYLTGFLGRLGALVLVAFGAAALVAGVVLALLCLWRLPGLFAGE
jgi:hypothetical protein